MLHKTVRNAGSISGYSLHSGERVEVTITPSTPGAGIRLSSRGIWYSVDLDNIGYMHANTTAIGDILSVEHLCSAFFGLGITSCNVHISGGSALPFIDGSSKFWSEFLVSLGIVEQDCICPSLTITDSFEFVVGDSRYCIQPSIDLIIDCQIDFSHCVIGIQNYKYIHTSKDSYVQEIAWARTFVKDIHEGSDVYLSKLRERLKSIDAAIDDNAILIYDKDKFINKPHKSDEPVRHKILDFLGDISICSPSIQGSFTMYKPSHRGNIALAQELRRRYL